MLKDVNTFNLIRKHANDPDILPMAEEGLADDLAILEELEV